MFIIRYTLKHCFSMAFLSTVLIIVVFGCESSEPSFRGTALDNSIPAGDFTLTDQDSQAFSLKGHRGKIILLFFGYAYCPDVCQNTLSTWKQVQDALKDESERLEFVFVTVDPERDTVERLRKHLNVYSSNFYGLTGRAEELQPVYDAFGVYRERVSISESATGYLMNPTARMFVVEGNGEWRLSYQFDTPADDIIHDIRQLLKQSEEAPLLELNDVWSRPTATVAQSSPGGTGVVYLTIVNHSDEPDRLLRVSSDVAEVIEIHETRMVGDRMTMTRVEGGLAIPSKGQVELKPAGTHLMLINLKQGLIAEDHFEVVLEFQKSGLKTIWSEVRSN